MADKKCIGIDCAWCASPECPNENKEIDKQDILDLLLNAYNKYFKEISKDNWRKYYEEQRANNRRS